MIRYKSDLFGLRTLLTWNGSAAFRAVVPALASTALVIVYDAYFRQQLAHLAQHPYVFTVFVSFYSFLLTTRLNFSYQRWWEAASMCHVLTSKLTDSAVCLASFHYQASIWNPIKPQSFGQIYANQKTNNNNNNNNNNQRRNVGGDDPCSENDQPKMMTTTTTKTTRNDMTATSSHQEHRVSLVRSSQPFFEVETTKAQNDGDDDGGGDGGGGGGGFFSWLQQTLLAAVRTTSEEKSSSSLSKSKTGTAPTTANARNDKQEVKQDRKTTKQNTPQPSKPPQPKTMRRSHSAPILLTKSFQPNRNEAIRNTPLPGQYSKRAFSSQRGGLPDGTTTGNHNLHNANRPFPTSAFLEEAVHLYSLLNAVAMASLRHDVEGCPSPLAEYIPNRPFPPYNPDRFQHRHGHLRVPSDSTGSEEEFVMEGSAPGTMTSGKLQQWYENTTDDFWNGLYFLAGVNRSPKQRTLYNAARPFHVLGGVSEAEARRLQLCRGPMAQVALCQLWLKEFITREYLNGSTGQVAPPIVGRIFQFLSDAIAAFHQCRKVAYVPFPFPHEQMTSLFTSLIVFLFPIVYVGFVNVPAFACGLNFVTMLCFQGIYEVARELSNPYHSVPNDLPLNRFHAQFNESLRVLLTGYHPNWKSERQIQREEDALRKRDKENASASASVSDDEDDTTTVAQ